MTQLAAVEPHQIANIDTEAGLLGALMYDNRQAEHIAEMVGPQDFSEEVHGRIFAAIIDKVSKGQNANPISLKLLFDDDPALKDVGGARYLAELSGSGAVTIGAKDFAAEIADLAKRRRLIEGLQEALASARRLDLSLDEIAAEAEAVVAQVGEELGGKVIEATAAKAMADMLKSIEQGLPPGVTSGIEGLDSALGPIRSGDLAIVAARPGMGKTMTALSYARNAAEAGHGCLFVSLEMSTEQLTMRLAADLCFDGQTGINFGYIEHGNLTTEQFRRLWRAQAEIEKLPLVIVDLPSIRAGRLNSLVRRHARRFAAKGQRLELVVLDYLQLVEADKAQDNRTAEVTQISRALKSCARANGIGLIALAQLSRKVEEREDKRPRLADLRESGSIEQDADTVLFLYRAEYYLLQSEPPEGSDKRATWEAALAACQRDIEFICAKRRQGETGIRHGRYYGCFQAIR